MKSTKWIKPLLIALIAIVLLVTLGKYLHLQEHLNTALSWIEGQGTVGMALYVVIYIVACIFFIPASLLTLGAGAIYGVVTGTLLVSLSSTLGATVAFLIGRYLARGKIAKKIDQNARFKAIDEAVAAEGWKMVGLTRLSPIFSFSLLNYAYGLTRVSLREYVLASWIAMIPGTLMYVYMGSLAGDLASLGSDSVAAPSAARWVINGIAFLATVVVTVYVTKIAKKALAEKIDE